MNLCSCGRELIRVADEEGRGVYECPSCPLLEWRECIRCHEINVCFPSLDFLCEVCSRDYIAVATSGPPVHGSAEEVLAEAVGCIEATMAIVEAIRRRARRRLGLPARAKVPRKIEDVCAALLRSAGCRYELGVGWTFPSSVEIL